MLEFKNVSFNVASKQILDNINVTFECSKINAIIGSNGSGKSTLIKMLLKKENEYSGQILYEDKKFEYCKEIAILMQNTKIPDHFTVYDFMKYSLLGSKSILSKITKADEQKIDETLALCDGLVFKNRYIGNLSGGERQRIIIGATLINKPKLLILDEPTTFLDIKYQTELLALINELNKSEQMTIIIVIHDINHGLKLADNIVMIKEGQIKYNCRSEDVDEMMLSDVFDVPFVKHGKHTFVTTIN